MLLCVGTCTCARVQVRLSKATECGGSKIVNSDDAVLEEVRACLTDDSIELLPTTPLIGDGRVLDSLRLVELCVRLEDRSAEMGFEFDWTSEAAMSRSRSIFRTIAALQEEFSRQQAEQS